MEGDTLTHPIKHSPTSFNRQKCWGCQLKMLIDDQKNILYNHIEKSKNEGMGCAICKSKSKI